MPETPVEVPVEEVKPDPRDKRIEDLNKESADRRVENKKLKESISGFEKKFGSILQTFGVDKEEDLESKLGEYRAAAAEKSNPELDPKVLHRKVMKLEDENKKLREDNGSLGEKYSGLSKKVEDRTIGAAVRAAITERGVKPVYHSALESFLRAQVRLDETDQVVWIQKTKDGSEGYPLDLADGLDGYFKANPDWLPATTGQGSGATASTRNAPSTLSGKPVSDMSVKEYNQVRDALLNKK